jgi:hypothetical protein
VVGRLSLLGEAGHKAPPGGSSSRRCERMKHHSPAAAATMPLQGAPMLSIQGECTNAAPTTCWSCNSWQQQQQQQQQQQLTSWSAACAPAAARPCAVWASSGQAARCVRGGTCRAAQSPLQLSAARNTHAVH